jgi:hypothetical protein
MEAGIGTKGIISAAVEAVDHLKIARDRLRFGLDRIDHTPLNELNEAGLRNVIHSARSALYDAECRLEWHKNEAASRLAEFAKPPAT